MGAKNAFTVLQLLVSDDCTLEKTDVKDYGIPC